MKVEETSSVLITGGAGFIGTNLAKFFIGQGKAVTILDNLSRAGVERNLDFLLGEYGQKIRFVRGDVRDADLVQQLVSGSSTVLHLAAQVAVTHSLTDPVLDFEINARGTLNILEAIRKQRRPASLIYTSTNKVLGGLEDIALRETSTRYEPAESDIREFGVGESRGLEFCSPYGCSKGAADQYVLDYAHTFGIPAVVFRMSCIYGTHQCGNEDQGWVAHFVKQTLIGEPITFYGDGKQVRDALYIDDPVQAFAVALENIKEIKGQAFNMGGGPSNTTSLLELVDLLREIHGANIELRLDDWRPSDQRYYVSDTRKFHRLTEWKAEVSFEEGVAFLYDWMKQNTHWQTEETRHAQI